ncbi:MAG: GNAT family N-acetyltransferase [Planctomycetota bacterium]
MTADHFDIGVAQPAEQREALSLALSEVDPSARAALVEALADAPREALGPLDALMVARHADRVVAATWAQPQAGDAASLWTPQAADSNGVRAFEALVLACADVVAASGTPLLQALLDPQDERRRDVLLRCGFERIAELVYLGRANPPEPPLADDRLAWAPITESDLPMLGELVRLTYAGSLDCPELGDRRNISATLRGYRAIGDSDLDGWRVGRIGEEPLAVVLCARHHGGYQAELVYMGLAPAARGGGHGEELVACALRIAHAWDAEQVVTAADARNKPARRLYERAGFAEWNRRHAFVRFNP